jgi:hypothetical protein
LDAGSFRSLGTLLQLVGVAVVAWGVMQVRAELQPDRSLLVKLQRWHAIAWQMVRGTLSRGWRWLSASVRRLWNTLRRRPPTERSGTFFLGSTAEVNAAGLPGEFVVSPPWESLQLDEKVEELRRRVSKASERTDHLDERQRDDHRAVMLELDDLRDLWVAMETGGLTVEAWGGGLVAVGIVVAGWPEWFAASIAAQAGLVGAALLAVGLFVTDGDRRWWAA